MRLRPSTRGNAAGAALLVLLLTLGGEGCGNPHPSPATGDPAEGGWAPNLDDELLSDADRRLFLDSSDAHAAAAQDGVITFQEYEAVVLEAIACWENVGFAPTHGLRITAYGTYHLVYGPSGEATPSEADQAEARRCTDEVLQPMHVTWSFAKAQKLPAQLFEDASSYLWQCIVDLGVDLDGRPADRSSLSYVTTNPDYLPIFLECQERTFDVFGLPNIG